MMMKTAKFVSVIVIFMLFATAGCSKYHKGRPAASGEPSAQEVVVPEVKQLVEQNVKDPEKARRVQDIIREIVKEVRRSSQEVRGFHEQLAALNIDYNAKPEQFTRILDQLNNARMESAAKILGMRFKAKDILTPEEWKNLNDAMAKARQEYASKARMGDTRPTGSSPSSGY
jgi:Glu-tRNA(Gln) amidotransferase subunit E-like FAD-binding protein